MGREWVNPDSDRLYEKGYIKGLEKAIVKGFSGDSGLQFAREFAQGYRDGYLKLSKETAVIETFAETGSVAKAAEAANCSEIEAQNILREREIQIDA